MVRRVLLAVAVAALAVGALLVLVIRLDLGAFAAARASAALGRPVTIASLRVTPGRWLRVELDGLRIGNIEGGTRPEMLTLGRASLEVDPFSLLRGPPVLRAVAVDGFSLYLERTGDRRKNWRFGPGRPPARQAPDRSGFPTLLDATLHRSEVLFRTSHGHLLRTRLEEATIRTEGDAAPVGLRATGDYNGVPLALDATLGPIRALRDSARPYGTALRMASGRMVLEFDGHMADPFDVDGAVGRATLHAPTPDALLALAGAEATLDAALDLRGQLERHGDVWRLSGAEGHLAGEAVRVRHAQLTEGKPGEPDAIALDLGMGRLDLNRRLAVGKRAGEAEADLPLLVSRNPDPLLQARIAVDELSYAKLEARDVRFHGALTPGRIAVDTLALTTSGARLSASGRLDARAKGGLVAAEVRLEEGDVDTLRRAFGLHPLPVSGRLDGWVSVAAEGETLNGAAREAKLSAVVAMQGGQIAREVIEMGSTDIRLLFRHARGTTAISCLLGMLEMQAGRGEVAPLRVRSAEGTIAGTASFDLRRRELDLVIGSVPSTTSFFALDIPMRVSGAFADPSILPAEWSEDGRARLAAGDDVAPLPARLRDFAQRNPCFQPGAAAAPAARPVP